MRLRAWAIGLAAAVAIGGCATPPIADVPVEDDDDPEAYVTPPAAPLVESPPLEPIEPIEAPPPIVNAPPPATSNTPPASRAPADPPAPAVTGSPPAAEPTEDQQMLVLLADLQRFGTLANDELKRELTAASQALARQRTDANRVRLAVLYTLLRTSPQDDQRAVQLFENVAKNAAPGSPVRQLAAVLQSQVVERQRAVRDEQQKADAAIQKLEALRAMERSLLRDRVRSGGGGGGGAGGSGR